MADKRRLQKTLHNLRRVQTWQLILVFILMAFITATFLRMNNVGMVQRRTAVADADKVGNIDVTRARLYDLQRYVITHMNASTGTFDLTDQYNRDTQAIYNEIKSESTQSANATAEAICHPQFSSWDGGAYMQCFLNEMAKLGPALDPTTVKFPDPTLYRYSFISPVWSFDFAGISLVITVVVALIIIARALSLVILKLLLKHHYREA